MFNNEDEKKYLSSDELHKFELYHEREKIRKMEKKSLEQEIRINALMIDVKRKEIEIQQKNITLMGHRHDNERVKHKRFYNDLLEKYNLTEGFGFDPESGEIKEKND